MYYVSKGLCGSRKWPVQYSTYADIVSRWVKKVQEYAEVIYGCNFKIVVFLEKNAVEKSKKNKIKSHYYIC